MRIGTGFTDYGTGTVSRNSTARGSRFAGMVSDTAGETEESRTVVRGSLLWQMTEKEDNEPAQNEQAKQTMKVAGWEAAGEASADRGEAVKIYEAAFKGAENPIEKLISAPKVPYGHLAKDGVIIHNGVLFTCDEKTNSICLGDVTDPKKVINIKLSGGGHLKVNRANIEQLGKAIDMFSPEDVNLIMRAIHQDTKLQSMQKEIEDLEAGVGEQIASDNNTAEADEKADKES